MKHVFISREGDKAQFVRNFESLQKLSNKELIEKYNNAVATEIFGLPGSLKYCNSFISTLNQLKINSSLSAPLMYSHSFVW